MFSNLNFLRKAITSFSSARRFSTLIVSLEVFMLIFNIVHFIGERNASRNDIIVSSKKGEMKCIIIIMFYTRLASYCVLLCYFTILSQPLVTAGVLPLVMILAQNCKCKCVYTCVLCNAITVAIIQCM